MQVITGNYRSTWTNDTTNTNKPNPFPIMERMDSRGEYKLSSSFVFAFGRTIKSGRLNIPLNMFSLAQEEMDGEWEHHSGLIQKLKSNHNKT
jgi:hypothetical protein